MLTNKQLSYLRSEAQTLKALYQLGKEGLSANFLLLIDKALSANELIKIHALTKDKDELRLLALDLASQSKAILVQIIGKVITLYRPSKKRLYNLSRY